MLCAHCHNATASLPFEMDTTLKVFWKAIQLLIEQMGDCS